MTLIRDDGTLAHGCTPRELAILDRSDAGDDPGAISRELGLALGYVRKVVAMYSGNWTINDAFDAMVVAGSARLAAAIAATGRGYS